MPPETKLSYNWFLSGIFNGTNFDNSKNRGEMEKVKKRCVQFEKLYNKHISHILSLIEKNTKCKSWRIPFIPIYILNVIPKYNTGWKAISDPLLLKFIPNPDRMFLILIHELVHLNEFKGHEDESIVDKIDSQIYEEIRLIDKTIKLTISDQEKIGKEESKNREILYKRLNNIR